MTILTCRTQICKSKIMSGFFRAAISFNSARISSPTRLPSAESDALFVEAIKMIDYDGLMFNHESLKGFRWYMMMWFPFPAYVCLLSGLRERTTGELCERAWDAICEHHERRKLMGHLRTPLHVAFAPLFVKAWDAREAAETQLGRTIAPPKLITLLRQRVASMPKRAKKSSSVPDHPTTPNVSIAPNDYAAAAAAAGAAPAPSPTTVPSQGSADSMPPPGLGMYPTPDPFGGMAGVGMPRQFTGFPEFNFGGEMDWNYLLQEYSDFMGPPPAPAPPQPQPPPQYQQHQHQHQQGVGVSAAHDPGAHHHPQQQQQHHPHHHPQSGLW